MILTHQGLKKLRNICLVMSGIFVSLPKLEMPVNFCIQLVHSFMIPSTSIIFFCMIPMWLLLIGRRCFPFQKLGEVLINHMVSDPVRAITQAKRKSTKEKYENTYLADFEKLVPYGSDKKAYENRVREIITTLKGNRKYYVAAFPFYNSQNSQVYSLLHCTSNEEGFKLYKKCAWKVLVDSHQPSTCTVILISLLWILE